jgi:hypothetical protein
MGTDTVATIRRKVSVFSNLGIGRSVRSLLASREVGCQIGATGFGALFSGIYGEENVCMSGIAMFIVRTR